LHGLTPPTGYANATRFCCRSCASAVARRDGHTRIGFAIDIGEITLPNARRSISSNRLRRRKPRQFNAGYGAGFWHDRAPGPDLYGRLVDRALRWKSWARINLGANRAGRGIRAVPTPTIFRRTGSEHIQTGPIVDFQSQLEADPQATPWTRRQGRRRGQAEGEGPSGGSLKGKMRKGWRQ